MKDKIILFLLAFVAAFILSVASMLFWYEAYRIAYNLWFGVEERYYFLTYLVILLVAILWALFSSILLLSNRTLMMQCWPVAGFALVGIFIKLIFTGVRGFHPTDKEFIYYTMISLAWKLIPVVIYGFMHAWLMRKISARWEGRTPQKNILDDDLLNEN